MLLTFYAKKVRIQNRKRLTCDMIEADDGLISFTTSLIQTGADRISHLQITLTREAGKNYKKLHYTRAITPKRSTSDGTISAA